jgi:putative phosphoesterase
LASVVRALVLADTHVDVVIFGHSHAPCNEWIDRQLLFNPGSSTWKRTAPTHTYGLLELSAGEVIRHEIVALAQSTAYTS